MVLGSVCRSAGPIHPAELPAVMKVVTAALAHSNEGTSPAGVLTPVAVLRRAVYDAVGSDDAAM
jgi:hypothetical protein